MKFSENTHEGVGRNTPKALANFSPGLERSDNPGKPLNILINPVRVIPHMPNAFSVNPLFLFGSQGWSAATTLGKPLNILIKGYSGLARKV